MSAIVFLCSVACYLPLIALLAFPAIGLWFARRDSTFRGIILGWFGFVGAAGCVAAAWLLATHRLAQIAINLREKAVFPQYAMPFSQRVLVNLFHHDMWTGFGLCAIYFIPAFAACATVGW
jgi:hypothetical protein